MEKTFEFKLVPATSIPFYLQRSSTRDLPPFLPKVSFSLRENWTESTQHKTFNYLEATLRIEQDDPRLRAIDIYTQYSGIHTLLIKHAPPIYPGGLAFYFFNGNWDDLKDREVDENEKVKTLVYSVDYAVASGLFAYSSAYKTSPNSELKLGMVKGKENPYSKDNHYSVRNFSLFFPVGNKNSDSNKFALDSKNPLCNRTFIFTDPHPIPFAIYNVWGYFNDDLGRGMANKPVLLAAEVYRPDHILVGKIVKKEARSTLGTGGISLWVYTIRYLTSMFPVQVAEVTTKAHLLNYEIGRWVLAHKDNDGNWYIVPSSIHYWKDVVDFYRKSGVL